VQQEACVLGVLVEAAVQHLGEAFRGERSVDLAEVDGGQGAYDLLPHFLHCASHLYDLLPLVFGFGLGFLLDFCVAFVLS